MVQDVPKNPDDKDKEEKPRPKLEKDVDLAINLITSSYHSIIRQNRMDNNLENKDLTDAFHNVLQPSKSPRQIKDTSLMQLVRLISEDLFRKPSIMAEPEAGQPELISRTVDVLVDKIKNDGNFENVVRRALTDSTNREGTSFVMAVPITTIDSSSGKDVKIDQVQYRNIDSASLFIDPFARRVDEADWFALRYDWGNDEAETELKSLYDFDGDVESGDPLNVYDVEESGENDQDNIEGQPDRTIAYEIWHKTKAFRLVIAGGDSKVIFKVKGKNKFPYKDHFGRPALPLEQLDATAYKRNLYSASYIDVAKDITQQKRRQFNQILPYFDRVSNQLLAVTGVTPLEDIASQISEAEAYQEQGMIPMLTLSDPQARIIPIFPDDITAPMERMNGLFTEELSNRLGLDLRIQERQEASGTPTATQVIERSRVHSKAVANINRINVQFYQNTSQMALNYARTTFANKDNRKVSVDSGSDNEFSLTVTEAIEATKKWRGRWFVDTTIDIDLTRNEQVSLLSEVKNDFVNDMQLPITSESEVAPLKDSMMAKVRLLKFDKVHQDAEIEAFYAGLVQRGQAQLQQAQEQAQAEQQQQQQKKGANSNTPATQEQAAERGANSPQPSANIA